MTIILSSILATVDTFRFIKIQAVFVNTKEIFVRTFKYFFVINFTYNGNMFNTVMKIYLVAAEHDEKSVSISMLEKSAKITLMSLLISSLRSDA